MLGIPLGLLAANATEWAVHKHILHGRARHKESLWAFHWHEHHRNVRKHRHYDEHYATHPFKLNGQGKEVAALALGAAVLVPLIPVAPFFVGTMWYSAANYYVKHRRSHLDVEWAKEHLPWHYDHHMGPNQNANWCVTHPFFDHVMGTREPYLGSERELRTRERRAGKPEAGAMVDAGALAPATA